jgi:hypothetical protein
MECPYPLVVDHERRVWVADSRLSASVTSTIRFNVHPRNGRPQEITNSRSCGEGRAIPADRLGASRRSTNRGPNHPDGPHCRR